MSRFYPSFTIFLLVCRCTHANQRLWPLLTTGDGNCLLHATSLAIWGVHDRQLNLRQLLHDSLTVSERRAAFYRRWRYQESKSNLQSQLVLTEEEWQKEWDTISTLASLTPRVLYVFSLLLFDFVRHV